MCECDRMTLLMREINIYILNTALVKDNFLFVSSFVDPERKEKALRYKNEEDQLLSFGAGYLLKKYLPSGEIKKTATGKPFLTNGPFFNLSHSGKYVVLVIHPTRDVGADIEKINKNRIDAIRFTLSEEEKEIADIDTLFLLWSNKESLIKCTSTGLKDIKNINGLPLEGNRVVEGIDYYTKSMIYDGYSLSITLKGKEPFNIVIKHINNLEDE